MKRLTVLLACLLMASFPGAEDLNLKIPRPVEGGHEYFPELLTSAFSAAGHRVNLEFVDAGSPVEVRDLLKKGDLDLAWFLASPDFTRGLIQVNFNLTKGLGGHYLLLLPRESPSFSRLSGIKTLAALKNLNLIGGVLAGSREAEVWRANGLAVSVWYGSPENLADGLSESAGGFDYLPRSLLSVPWELKKFPSLKEEPQLMLIFPEDFRFFLSGKNSRWESLILDTLEKSDRNGTLDTLLNQTFKIHNQRMNLVGRNKIFLQLPLAKNQAGL